MGHRADGWHSDGEINHHDPRSENEANGTQNDVATSSNSTDLYITHKVTKFDTLAGLAIKYNVSVSDIKRINGLLSDTAMFARDTLLIPKESLSIGQEYSAWAAMIITRHGQLSTGGGHSNSLLGIGGTVQSNDAIEQLKRYYNLGGSPTNGAGARGLPVRSRSDQSLLEMSSMNSFSSRPDGDAAAGQSITVLLRDNAGVDDRVRRRRVADAAEQSEGQDEELLSPPDTSAGPSGSRPVKPVYGRTQATASNESLIQKLKRVTSANPALSSSAAHIGQAAGGLVSSLSQGVKPGIRSLKKLLSADSASAPAAPPPRTNAKKD